MSVQNQISIIIPQTVIDEITTKLKECKTALVPFTKGLTDSERQTILKMGDKTVSTIQKTQSYVTTNPEFAPSYMDKVEFDKDVNVVTQLSPILNLAQQIARDTDDTIMIAGSEAFYSALLYYGTVNEAHKKGVPTAQPIYDDLKQRFAKSPRKPK